MIGIVSFGSLCYAADSDDIVSEDQDIMLVDILVSTDLNGSGRFNCPTGLTVDTSGDIYIADSVNSRIQKFNKDGEFLQFIGTAVYENGVRITNKEVCQPIGIALDENANIYVADFAANRIKVFDKDGNFLRTWLAEAGAVETRVVGIACGNNSVYVTDKDNHRILRYSLEGTFLCEWGQEGSANGELDYPSGIAVDDVSEKVYVVDVNNDRIQIFGAEGNFIDSFPGGITSSQSWPMFYDVLVDSDQIYVSAPRNYAIRIFDKLDTSISEDVYIQNQIFPGDQPYPNGITLWDGEILTNITTYHSADGVAKINELKEVSWFFGEHGTCDEDTVSQPVGLVINRETRKFYVTDFWDCRVQRFDLDGNFEVAWGKRGFNQGEFCCPEGIAIDQSGDIYVNDSGRGRIQKFDPDGNFLQNIGSPGYDPGQFMRNVGVAVDLKGNIYATDMVKGDIQKFDYDGNFIMMWDSWNSGEGSGQFVSPRGICVDSEFVYVVDETNWMHYLSTIGDNLPASVYKFTLEGDYVTEWTLDPSTSCGCPRLYDITFDLDGNLFIADTRNGEIFLFQPDGTLIDKWDLRVPMRKSVTSPQGLAVDADGYIYVADFVSSSILVGSESSEETSLGPVLKSSSEIDQGGGVIAKYRLVPGTGGGGGGGGCNISAIPAIGFILLLPIMFLSGTRK